MRILYICDNLATFIFNEILQIQRRGHEILILAEGTSRIHQAINEPILLEHGLDKTFYRFSKFSSRGEKYRSFIPALLYDALIHPLLTGRACYFFFSGYSHPKYGVVDYVDIRQFLNERLDLIHAPFSIPPIIDKVAFLANVLDIPYTLSFKAHDIWQGNHLTEARKRRKKIVGAASVFTIARHNQEYLQTQLQLDGPIEVIHDAIDVSYFAPRKPLNRLRNSILAVSRLHPEKGLAYLIRACHLLQQRNIAYTCTIVGEGPERRLLDQLIDELQVPNISFAGFLTYDQVRRELSRASVFVLPSIIDSDGLGDVLPNGVKEAMAMQVPVVTSNIRGISELVEDGVNGLLVPVKDASAIADAVERIFKDSHFSRCLGQHGRKKIEQDFNATIEVGKIEKIFLEAQHTDVSKL